MTTETTYVSSVAAHTLYFKFIMTYFFHLLSATIPTFLSSPTLYEKIQYISISSNRFGLKIALFGLLTPSRRAESPVSLSSLSFSVELSFRMLPLSACSAFPALPRDSSRRSENEIKLIHNQAIDTLL